MKTQPAPIIAPPSFEQTFASTRGKTGVDLASAVLSGPAPDGGLWVPEQIVGFTETELDHLEQLPFLAVATEVMQRLLGTAMERAELEALIASALDFDIPLRAIGATGDTFDARSLDLFCGPTLAFKDVGARFMARLLRWARSRQETSRELEILVATSGDTGSAVAHAFLGLEGFKVTVLFPKGQVSEAQRKLFTTLGQNTRSIAVRGTFDDCQRMVKRAFADNELRRRKDLGSANSINIARLLPQTLYYFWIRNQLSAPDRTRPLVVSVPSGNFGNLTAGLLAQRLGLRIDRFIAATNRNDIVPAFLAGGSYQPRPSMPTVANAMDVGDPSNFERILWLYGQDQDAIRRDIRGARFSDVEIKDAMRRHHVTTAGEHLNGPPASDHLRLLDPHTAVAYLAAQQDHTERRATIKSESEQPIYAFLATAHPAKFDAVVKDATGETVGLPSTLSDALARSETVTELEPDYDALRTYLDD